MVATALAIAVLQPLLSGTGLLSGVNSAVFSCQNVNRDAVQVSVCATANSWSTLTLTLQGSMDGVNFFSTGKTLTADGVVDCTSRIPYYRLAATGGGAGVIAWAVY